MNELERPLTEEVARLIAAPATLLDDYARWRPTLRDAEDIWALAAWRTAIADEPVTAPVPIAA